MASEHEDPFADPIQRTTSAGVVVGSTVAMDGEHEEGAGADIDADAEKQQLEAAYAPPTATTEDGAGVVTAPPRVPLYKRRWFIITGIVGSCLGIALLFIILFPVVKAIIQYVVDQAVLNIDVATIAQPQNTS